MSSNQPSPGDRKNSNDGPDWNDMFGKLALGVLGGLAVGAGVLAVAKAYKEDSDKDSQEKDDGALIAVDATRTTGGGILVIPQIKTVYYYSADLTKRFTFMNESDKFEMVNAFVALETFADRIAADYRGTGVKVLTDNYFSCDTSYSHTRNTGFKALRIKVTKRLEGAPFFGEWEWVSKHEIHIKIADKLSHEKIDAADETMSAKYPGYSKKQIDADKAVDKVSQAVRDIASGFPELCSILK